MSSITIQVPKELATRLKPYREKLPQILELGLEQLETKTEPNLRARERTLQVLRSTGLIQPINFTWLDHPRRGRRRHSPVKMPGKPLSELIIEQRGRLDV